jgi:hypothetical protein
MDAFTGPGSRVIVNERFRKDRNEDLITEAFLYYPLCDMDRFDVPRLAAFLEVKFDKAFSDIVTFEEIVMRCYNIPQKGSGINLDAVLP